MFPGLGGSRGGPRVSKNWGVPGGCTAGGKPEDYETDEKQPSACERAISECGDGECYCDCADSITDCLRVCFIGNANMISSTVLRTV